MANNKAILEAIKKAKEEKRVTFSTNPETTFRIIRQTGENTWEASFPGYLLIGLVGLEEALRMVEQKASSVLTFLAEPFGFVDKDFYFLGLVNDVGTVEVAAGNFHAAVKI